MNLRNELENCARAAAGKEQRHDTQDSWKCSASPKKHAGQSRQYSSGWLPTWGQIAGRSSCIPIPIAPAQLSRRHTPFRPSQPEWAQKRRMAANCAAVAGSRMAIAPVAHCRPGSVHKRPVQQPAALVRPALRRHRRSVAVSATAAPPAVSPFSAVQNEEDLFALLKAGASGGSVSVLTPPRTARRLAGSAVCCPDGGISQPAQRHPPRGLLWFALGGPHALWFCCPLPVPLTVSSTHPLFPDRSPRPSSPPSTSCTATTRRPSSPAPPQGPTPTLWRASWPR